MNRQKIIIFSTLLVEVLGISIIIPAFPELKVFYGISDFQVTLGFAVYSICAFLAAPVLWQWSDRIGRKWSLALCIGGTMLSYVALLVTQQYWIFLLARAINGITGGNIAIIQAILNDISPDKVSKSKNFWLMWAFFWLGFVIGPVIGALCLKFGDINTIFWIGAVLAGLEFVMIAVSFRDTLHPHESDYVPAPVQFNSFSIIWKYLRKDALRNLLLSMFALWVGWFMINASQSLYMNDHFGTSGERYGYYLAVMWLIVWLNMAVLLPKFWTKIMTYKSLIIMAHIVLIVWYFMMWQVGGELIYIIIFYLTVLLSGYYGPIYQTIALSDTKPREVGELSGMLSGAQSLFMFVGPLIGGLFLDLDINLFTGAAVLVIISGVLMWRYFIQHPMND